MNDETKPTAMSDSDASKPSAEYFDTEFGGESGTAGMFTTRGITPEEASRLAAKYYERFGDRRSIKINAHPFIRANPILPEEKTK
jgi:hypothetical protein